MTGERVLVVAHLPSPPPLLFFYPVASVRSTLISFSTGRTFPARTASEKPAREPARSSLRAVQLRLSCLSATVTFQALARRSHAIINSGSRRTAFCFPCPFHLRSGTKHGRRSSNRVFKGRSASVGTVGSDPSFADATNAANPSGRVCGLLSSFFFLLMFTSLLRAEVPTGSATHTGLRGASHKHRSPE